MEVEHPTRTSWRAIVECAGAVRSNACLRDIASSHHRRPREHQNLRICERHAGRGFQDTADFRSLTLGEAEIMDQRFVRRAYAALPRAFAVTALAVLMRLGEHRPRCDRGRNRRPRVWRVRSARARYLLVEAYCGE